MSKSLLSEQLGAMALVDQLRHQQMEVEEHLNMPQRRTAVAARIREYYQNNGIAFTDAQIDQGVREFFDKRLTFDAPPQGMLNGWVCTALLNRRWVLLIVLCVIVGALAVQGARMFTAYGQTRQTALVLDAETVERQSEWRALKARLRSTQQFLSARHEPGAERLLTRADEWLNQAAPLVAKPAQVNPLLRQSEQALNQSLAIFKTRERLVRLQKTPAYLAAIDVFNALAIQAAKADDALANADTLGIDNAEQQIVLLEEALQKTQPLEPLTIRFAPLNEAVADIAVPENEKKGFYELVARAKNHLNHFDEQQAEETLDSLSDSLKVATSHLTLSVIDRLGTDPWVERNNRWYLIVQALDESYIATKLPITDSVTGETQWTKRFAIRVSRAEFLRVKGEYAKDAYPVTQVVGSKPVNRMDVQFNQRVIHPVEALLTW